ncbi:sphingomyelin phosphodiesterase-like [Coccinella septempunctata]|uniref:sphingomyelin phosphodiesterase-like n=1 Tax=Coccinella septempunctata TaxID=41139 RepID=UPI001D08BBF8|nr:sphingomyelin phosphodiesterase-like [Coccinella septempunctata]
MKGLLLFTIFSLCVFQKIGADDAQLLKDGLTQFLHTGLFPEYLKDVSKYHQIDSSVFEQLSIGNLSSVVTCTLCDELANSIISLKKIHTPDIFLKNIITKTCKTFKVEDDRVCNGLLGPIIDVIFYIIENGKNVTGPKLCSLLLGPTCHNQFDYFNWTVDVPPKPEVIPRKVISGDDKIRILHLTDMHIDPRYTPGSNAVCGETLCCQDDQGIPENSEDACGVWGDYRSADTPMKLLEETLRHAKAQNVDYVYSTGDIIPHRVWSTSRESNSELELEIMDLLRDSFDVPVLFVLGNHEPHPMNMYAPLSINQTSLSTKWLYDALRTEELAEFPDERGLGKIEAGGFYTVLLRPGFRVIVLNNNACYTENYWLAYEDYDLYGQLAWLIEVLSKAEQDGEYVHILYHIPTGYKSCLGTWAREYNKILNRFTETISGQFSGHTHADEFFLYYNISNPAEAIQIAFNGASLSTYVENNPSYKIYDVNTRNYRVDDFEEWTFNLTDANLYPEKNSVDWYKLYSFRETYGLSSLDPIEVGRFVEDLAKNKTLLEIYNKIKFRMGTGADKVCDDDCHKANLCSIVTAELGDTFHCERIKKIYEDNNGKL